MLHGEAEAPRAPSQQGALSLQQARPHCVLRAAGQCSSGQIFGIFVRLCTGAVELGLWCPEMFFVSQFQTASVEMCHSAPAAGRASRMAPQCLGPARSLPAPCPSSSALDKGRTGLKCSLGLSDLVCAGAVNPVPLCGLPALQEPLSSSAGLYPGPFLTASPAKA